MSNQLQKSIEEFSENLTNLGILSEKYLDETDIKPKEFIEIGLKITELRIELLKLSGGV